MSYKQKHRETETDMRVRSERQKETLCASKIDDIIN
jgi:hypothetical protein